MERWREGDRKVTAHPLWTRQHLDSEGVKRQVRGPFVLRVFRSMNTRPT